MIEQCILDSHDQDAARLQGSQVPALRFAAVMPFPAPIGLLEGGVNLDSSRWREYSPDEAVLDTFGRCKPWQNPTGA